MSFWLRSWLVAAACSAFACGDDPILCDGSDEVRWAATKGFSARPYAPPFLRENGALRISIDGQCQFSLYDDSPRGLRRGVIDAQRARVLANVLHFGDYAGLAGYPPSLCLDAAAVLVADGTATLQIECLSSDRDAPSELASLEGRIEALARELDPISEHVWRPVQIQVVAVPPPQPTAVPSQPIYDWNAPFDLAAHALDYADYPGELPATGVPVEDDATLAHLDELRRIDIAADDAVLAGGGYRVVEFGLFVRDAQGRVFQVLVRDEPSAAVRQGWDVLFTD